MSDDTASALGGEGRLGEAILVYLRGVEAGHVPAREEVLARYPDVAEGLRTFFADQDRLDPLLSPLRCLGPDGVRAPPHAGGEGRRHGLYSADTDPYAGPADPGGAGGGALPEVPGYEVLGVVGRGGMGVVYRARQVGLDRPVALKMLRADTPPDDALRARFEAEARAVARLEHPNVVRVYDSGEHRGQPYFVLELVGGGSLARRITESGPWPARAAASLVARLAEAVGYAHSRGIVHRDLKPANVLLAADGTPKVADFGLARWLRAGGAGLTLPGARPGTPAYMAPEQAGGRTEEVGPAADVFGLGGILYALLTGRAPFEADTPGLALEKAKSGEVVPPRQVNPSVPSALGRICLRALEADPARRYPSAEALAEELRRWLRRRWVAVVAGLVAGLLLFGVALGALLRGPGTGEAPPLSGELTVRLWSPADEARRGLRVDEPGALPAREGDLVRIEARLNRPAHVYLLHLDGQGAVTPLYPWNEVELVRGLDAAPPERPRRARVVSPSDARGKAKGWPLDDRDGLETVVLLARRTRLPRGVDLAGLVGKVPATPLRDPQEYAVRGHDAGQPAGFLDLGEHRGLQKQAEEVDDPLLQLLERLRPHFETVRAVRFAHQGR